MALCAGRGCPSNSRIMSQNSSPPPSRQAFMSCTRDVPMSTGWSEYTLGGGCCFRRTISTISGVERCSNSLVMITWLKWDSFTTKLRQCSWRREDFFWIRVKSYLFLAYLVIKTNMNKIKTDWFVGVKLKKVKLKLHWTTTTRGH